MKPEEQRIAIAEACGWTEIGVIDYLCGIHPQMLNAKAYDGSPLTPPIWEIPDYLKDLNAIHEAETLVIYANDKFPKKYTQQIKAAICRDAGVKKAQMDFDMCITATAAQRAEAFLKTLNLWKQ
jgi:hypothetical protein